MDVLAGDQMGILLGGLKGIFGAGAIHRHFAQYSNLQQQVPRTKEKREL